MRGSECQDNSKNNVAAVYFESSLMMHNPLFFVHKSGLSLRAGVGDFPWLLGAWAMATFRENKRKIEPKILGPCCTFLLLLIT